FRQRKFYPHNPNVTLMRTTPEECRQLGHILAEKINLSTGPVAVLLPLQGWSMIDAPDGPFWWPEANDALHQALKQRLRPDVRVIELNINVNDSRFSRCAAETLLELMATPTRQ
ncbi:MAG: Tm-1-like ATP-binding domain-containing protein, partial [Pirellulaceae bacterium]